MTSLIIRPFLNILLVAALAYLLPNHFVVGGGFIGILIVGILIGIFNILIKPILSIITLPIRLLSDILASIIVNSLFLWFVEGIVQGIDVQIVTLDIRGGFFGFLLVAAVFGLLNWIMKNLLP